MALALLIVSGWVAADDGSLAEGYRQLNAGNFAAAITDFDSVVSGDPSNLKAHEGLARSYYDSRNFTKAAEEADRSLALGPDSPAWRADWATIVREAPGRAEATLSTVRQWATDAPSDPAAQLLLGRMLFDTGDLAGARRIANAVLVAAPENVDALRALAAVERFEQHYGTAQALLERAAALRPQDENLQSELAAVRREAEAFRAAQLQPTIPLTLAVILFAVIAGQTSRTARSTRPYLLAGTAVLVAVAFGWLYLVPLG